MGLLTDDRGQWILLSGIVIAAGLVVLMLLLNTAMLSGHSSTASIMSFPKNDIRDLGSEPVQEARIIAAQVNKLNSSTGGSISNTNSLNYFNLNYSKFASDMITAYGSRGASINIIGTPDATNGPIGSVNISVYYDNGNTYFQDNYTIYT